MPKISFIPCKQTCSTIVKAVANLGTIWLVKSLHPSIFYYFSTTWVTKPYYFEAEWWPRVFVAGLRRWQTNSDHGVVRIERCWIDALGNFDFHAAVASAPSRRMRIQPSMGRFRDHVNGEP
nr:hypothetical protein CFP56_42528 [Quercus suber]